MLVLSRKPQQTIVLSSGATFKVLSIEKSRVQIGVSAPKGVRILRGECPGAATIGAAEAPISAELPDATEPQTTTGDAPSTSAGA